jgi:transcriptional/translational regulatory protein YebC/TACO1
VRNVVNKGGGKMAESGSVMFQFERQGLLFCSGVDEEALFEVHPSPPPKPLLQVE